MNTNITRRSTIGFGYTSAVENDDRGNLRVCNVSDPIHTGTILTVQKAISEDRTLASFRGGTFYRTAYFVKVDGKWHKIKNTDENNWNLDRLSEKRPDIFGQMKYEADVVSIEVE